MCQWPNIYPHAYVSTVVCIIGLGSINRAALSKQDCCMLLQLLIHYSTRFFSSLGPKEQESSERGVHHPVFLRKILFDVV